MPAEADTCRTYVIPKLKSAGWGDDYISEQRHIVAHLERLPSIGDLRQAKVNALPALCSSGRLQSGSGEELSALMPSILDKAFKGEL
jgi:hypothetical protein